MAYFERHRPNARSISGGGGVSFKSHYYKNIISKKIFEQDPTYLIFVIQSYRVGKKFGKFFDNRKIISNSLRSDHIRTNLIQINISDYTEFDSAQFPFLK